MTREEAIQFIGQSVKDDVDMANIADAISALEQEPCDAISLDAVIEWLKAKDFIKMSWQEENARKELQEYFSVTPSRRKGHWIYRREDKYSCSKCGTTTRVDESGIEEKPMYKFCPNCGAEMESEKE